MIHENIQVLMLPYKYMPEVLGLVHDVRSLEPEASFVVHSTHPVQRDAASTLKALVHRFGVRKSHVNEAVTCFSVQSFSTKVPNDL